MGRNPHCSEEDQSVMKRGAWTEVEDQILKDYIKTHGEGKWRNIPKQSGLKRCGKSCRLRWLNYLRPGIVRGNITEDEEDLIIRLHKLLGNRWSLIAGRLPGRTDNEIKNYWNTALGKKVKASDDQESKHVNPDKKMMCVKRRRKPSYVNVKDHVVNSESDKTSEDRNIDHGLTLADGQSNNNSVEEAGEEEEEEDSGNLSMDFDVENLLLSDISDSEFWKLCQFDDWISK